METIGSVHPHGKTQSSQGSSSVRHRMRPSRPDRAMSRPAFHRLGQAGPERLEVVAQDVGHAVAVEVAGRVQPVKNTPRLGRLAAKGAQLAVNRAPEVGQAVAVEVGGLRPGQPGDRMLFVARRGRQEMNDRRVG